jgi:hypothetical protein
MQGDRNFPPAGSFVQNRRKVAEGASIKEIMEAGA